MAQLMAEEGVAAEDEGEGAANSAASDSGKLAAAAGDDRCVCRVISAGVWEENASHSTGCAFRAVANPAPGRRGHLSDIQQRRGKAHGWVTVCLDAWLPVQLSVRSPLSYCRFPRPRSSLGSLVPLTCPSVRSSRSPRPLTLHA